MQIRVLDIGGSGVKTALFSGDSLQIQGDVQHFADPDWRRFEEWCGTRLPAYSGRVGISCAGFVDATTGEVKLFRVGGWIDKRLKHDFEGHFPNTEVAVVNDAEAHLMAHMGDYPHPHMCLALGSALGFACTNENGDIVRPRRCVNFDLGEMTISTRAANKQVWWALGSLGLRELQDAMGRVEGAQHFGFRLGAFARSLCSVFRPRTLVFSGGVTESWWEEFSPSMREEFLRTKPDWLDFPTMLKSRYGKNAALWGMMRFVKLTAERS